MNAGPQSGYDGAVAVGGPPQTRDLGPLTITKLAVGPMDNNAYFLRCRETGDVVLIDAANEPDRLLNTLHELAPDTARALAAVVTTHRHADHWQGLPEVVAATGAPVVAHPLDAGELPVTAARLVEDGGEIAVGNCMLRVIHLVGHTPGSIALLYDGEGGRHLFTGDCLFPGGVGRTTDPEDFDSLLAGVQTKVFDPLPDDTWIYPGHGNDTTIGAERPHLAEWRERGW